MDTINEFKIKKGKELTERFLKSDVLLLACVFEKFIKLSVNELILIFYIVLVYQAILGSVV